MLERFDWTVKKKLAKNIKVKRDKILGGRKVNRSHKCRIAGGWCCERLGEETTRADVTDDIQIVLRNQGY